MIAYIGQIAGVVPNLRLIFVKCDRHDPAVAYDDRLCGQANRSLIDAALR